MLIAISSFSQSGITHSQEIGILNKIVNGDDTLITIDKDMLKAININVIYSNIMKEQTDSLYKIIDMQTNVIVTYEIMTTSFEIEIGACNEINQAYKDEIKRYKKRTKRLEITSLISTFGLVLALIILL